MKKLLITGASGFLGSNFCRKYYKQFELYGAYNKHSFDLPGTEALQIDLSRSKAVGKLLDRLKPDGIIHLSALSDPNYCELHPEESLRDNIEATEHLVTIAANMSVPFVFSSTDLVFDGRSAPYLESDLPGPISVYGQHKAIAEEIVTNAYPEAVVCRLPLMYGFGFARGQSFLKGMLNNLSQGQQVRLFEDEFRTPASAERVSEGLLLCLQKGHGTYHLGGSDSLSRYQIGEIVCEVFGFSGKLLIPSHRKEVSMPAPRPANVSLSSARAKDLGWQQGNFKDELLKLKEEFNILHP